MAYSIISLEDMYKSIDEKKIKEILKNFTCDKNKDVEYFIREKAIEFLKFGISKTFLVMSSYRDKQVIVGYFALTNKVTRIKKSLLSKTKQKRLKQFATNDEDSKYFTLSLPLIGQLGKNYYNDYNKLISGDILLKLACDKVKEAQQILGGKFVVIECEDKQKLKEFYENNGFVCFDKRNLEKEEREKNQGEYLLQMLCDLSKN